MKTCNRCNGRGHDKGGRPEFHFEERKTAKGRIRKQFVTDKRGSGCIKCLGTGSIES